MNLRRLTETGMERFGTYLSQLREDSRLSPPFWLLEDSDSSVAVADVTVEARQFANRLEAARYLHSLLTTTELTMIDQDTGLWSWLALYYFDQVCPEKKGGHRKPAAITTYIPDISSQRRLYRHCLLGPWQLFRMHEDDPDRLKAQLCSRIDVSTSEVYRLFIENPTIASCRAAVAVASALYFDPKSKRIKRGAGVKGPGGCRRLLEFLQQLDCTYDLSAIPPDHLMQMLPREFNRFVPRQQELKFGRTTFSA